MKVWACCLGPWQSQAWGRPWASVSDNTWDICTPKPYPTKKCSNKTVLKALLYEWKQWKIHRTCFIQTIKVIGNSLCSKCRTINGYLSEGRRAAKGLILTIVHSSCNRRHGNKYQQQSALILEASLRLHERTHTHTSWVPSNSASWSDSPTLIELIPTSGSTVPGGLTLHSARLQLSPSEASD